MAEAAVGALLVKLGAALAKEATTYGASLLYKKVSPLKALFGEIRKAKGDLEMMKAYLRESEKFKDTDEITSIFIDKIRDLSFQIEDVVDEFMYKLEDDKHGGFAAKMKKRIKHLRTWRRLALKLRRINVEIEETAKRRDRFAIPGTGIPRNSHQTQSDASCFGTVVGIENNAAKLKGWLVDDLEVKNMKITTVWGMGGVGKTTLVDHVYNIVKASFDAAAWVTVSKSYQAEDLLKRIPIEFGISITNYNMGVRRLVEAIREHLQGKTYILVLDDVWEQDLWLNKIMQFFPINHTCRFVLTSRLSEVASLATSDCTIKLEPLKENHSYMLFCKLAFWNNDNKTCPRELLDLATKFLEKCAGLPIAIACIGRLLSCRPATYTEWNNVYEKLELQPTENTIPGVDNILKVSMEDLPYELKNCFLYCALFPEDYLIKRRRLIRHWIASGFIKDEEKRTVEQVAEGYLNELVNRSLLQVVSKNIMIGRVKCCRMHDLIRRLVIDKAERECFGKVYEKHETSLVGETRRLSIASTKISSLNQSGETHLRGILVFTSFVHVDLLRSILGSSSLLSTLDLQGTAIKILPNEVFSLFNLRFLGLRNTQIEVLPAAIGKLQNLEVLDAFNTGLLSLPKDVAKLKKLRYLYATKRITEGTFWRYGGVKVPRGAIKNLTRMHALQKVRASLETLSEVASLKDLRTFAVDNVTSEHSFSLSSALRSMSNLVSLSITTSNQNELLPLEELRLPKTIYKLVLIGKLEKTRMPHILESWKHLNNLKVLCLMFSKLDENSFASLKVLHNLCFLELVEAYDGNTICFPAQSFPKVRELRICGAPHLNQVEIEEDALGSLDKLWFLQCPEFKCLPRGIEYLKALDELRLVDAADEFIEMLGQEREANEELTKISHIRKITVESTMYNFWRRNVPIRGNGLAG